MLHIIIVVFAAHGFDKHETIRAQHHFQGDDDKNKYNCSYSDSNTHTRMATPSLNTDDFVIQVHECF